MKIYSHPMSNHAARVHMLIAELGLDAEQIVVDLRGDNREPWFLKLNPNAKVPVLEDDGFVVWESHAIMRYLCAKHGPTSLYPEEPRARAHVDQWLDWGHTRLNHEAITINFNTVVLGEHGDAARVAQARADLTQLLPVLDAQLAAGPFVCGEQLTLADLSLFSSVVYLEQNSVPLEGYPHMQGWFARLKQRPSGRLASVHAA